MRLYWILSVLLTVSTTGCNTTTRIVPKDESARELLRGRDCSVSFLDSSRTANVERAKLDGRPINNPTGPSSTIEKIHHIEFSDGDFWFGRQRCVEVVGE